MSVIVNIIITLALTAGLLSLVDIVAIVAVKGWRAGIIGFWAPLYTRVPGGHAYWLFVKGGRLDGYEEPKCQ